MVEDLDLIALSSGSFLFEVKLQTSLQIPIKLLLAYFDVDSDRRMNTTSRESYFSSISIRHIDRVPFDRFRVELALVHESSLHPDLVGPFFKPSNVYCKRLLYTLLFYLP